MSKVLQFKIKLDGIKPPIWRRIIIDDDCSFWDLHIAIQNAMGWNDSHLHEFIAKDPVSFEQTRITFDCGDMDVYADLCKTLSGSEVKVKNYLPTNKKFCYIYDFGDNWEHTIIFEKILERSADKKYPICIDGARPCPPEDIGGVSGYENFLEIIGNKNHPEYQSMCEWYGEQFVAEHFELCAVKISNPK